MTKAFIMSCLLAVTNVATATAQSATQVLDRTAANIRGGGTVHASFRITQYEGTVESGVTSGEIWMAAERFRTETPELSTWYDGKTLWSMLAGSGEVNVIPPDSADPLTTSPYHFLSIYKHGYKTSCKDGSLRGKKVHTVTLRAKKKDTQPQVIVLDITRDTYQLMCIRAQQDGDWTRIALLTYDDHCPTPEGFFTFDASKYPGVEVIDLR